MFKCRLSDIKGKPVGPPLWVTGDSGEAKANGFKWSTVMSAWVKPTDEPTSEAPWPVLLDGGVYRFAMSTMLFYFVVEPADDYNGWVLHRADKYVMNVADSDGGSPGAWHCDAAGTVFDSDMQPVGYLTELDFMGVTMLHTALTDMTVERISEVNRAIQSLVQKWYREDADDMAHESEMAAEADEWAIAHEV